MSPGQGYAFCGVVAVLQAEEGDWYLKDDAHSWGHLSSKRGPKHGSSELLAKVGKAQCCFCACEQGQPHPLSLRADSC